MKRLSRYITYILPTLLLAACTDELPVAKSPQQYLLDGDYYFVLESDGEPLSRMTYEGIKHSEFSTGDRIGVFAPQNSDKSQIPNDVFSARDMSVNPPSGPTQVLVPADDEIKKEVPKKEPEYLLYYPYRATQSLEGLSNGTMSHTVAKAQDDKDGLVASDLLWCHKLMTDEEKNADYVTIHMHHAMATIVVKVAKDSIDVEAGAVLTDMPLTAKGIKLRDVNQEITPERMVYTTDINGDRGNIAMYRLPDDTDEYNYVYRAVVPACQTLAKDKDILTVYLKDKKGEKYEHITYKLARDIELQPGKYYTFNLRSGQKPAIPDYTDDDSWVLEVYNPDGKMVGLLCREYIYYEPAGLSNYRNDEANISNDPMATFKFAKPLNGNLGRGDQYVPATFPASDDIKAQLNMSNFTESDMKLAVNSQAWVFYNMKADGNPDLTCGTVLRFIFDIKCGAGPTGRTPTIIEKYMGNNVQAGCDKTLDVWPYPHNTDAPPGAQGMFKTRHGHELINAIMINGASSAYAYDSREYLEFYMHGGKVIWDPENNIVDEFTLPYKDGELLRVKNIDAEQYGHIAFNEATGEAFVSFSPFDRLNGKDEDGNGVCTTIEKKLNFAGEYYPLRKIGFNHFWIAKSLHTKVDIDGNPLECFSTGISAGSVNYDAYIDPEWGKDDEIVPPSEGMKYSRTDLLPAGYIYPSVKKGDDITDPNNLGMTDTNFPEDYDTYNHPESWDNIALLYNLTCIADKNLIPKGIANEEWRIPTWKDMAIMRRYGGYAFAARWITDEIRTRVRKGVYAETISHALEKGWLIGTVAYCANISGLDLKPFGCKIPQSDIEAGRGKTSDFGVRPHFFIDSETDNIFDEGKQNRLWFEIFRFSPWDCWESNPMANYRTIGHTTSTNQNDELLAKGNSRVFAPVRLIMSYKNPVGPAANDARMQKMHNMKKTLPLGHSSSKVINVNIIKSASEK